MGSCYSQCLPLNYTWWSSSDGSEHSSTKNSDEPLSKSQSFPSDCFQCLSSHCPHWFPLDFSSSCCQCLPSWISNESSDIVNKQLTEPFIPPDVKMNIETLTSDKQ